MFRKLILYLFIGILPLQGLAETAKPSTYADTLRIMAEYLETHHNDLEVTISFDDNTLKVRNTDGRGYTFFSRSLHQKLLDAETGLQRDEILSSDMKWVLKGYALIADDPFDQADLKHVMPVLRHKDNTALILQGEHKFLIGRTFGDMLELFVLDTPRKASYIKEIDLKNSTVSVDEVIKRAAKNLLIKDFLAEISQVKPKIYMIELDRFYESSLLLDTQFWSSLHTTYGDLYVVAPTRDTVMFTPLENEYGIGFLTGAKERLLKKDFHPLSSYSYVRTKTVWRVWDGKSWEDVK